MAEGNESSLWEWLFGALAGARSEPSVRCVDLRALMERDHEHGPPSTPKPIPMHGMVRWMQPSILLAAGKEVVLSELFSRFADKRELEASLDAAWFDASGISETLWLDYASDTGDGFETTYAIASLLGRKELKVRLGQGEEASPGEPRTETLPRGDILVLGGDQVYPAADWDAYQERFVNVFTAAMPDAGHPRPVMFALPGNHDWYDGLTSFMRLFCTERLIGGWQLCQRRSYFAIKLAAKRWLWAVDTQLDTYVDNAQLSYFWAMAKMLEENDEVILVTAKPSWVASGEDDPAWNLGDHEVDAKDVPQSWQTLAFIEGRLVGSKPKDVDEGERAFVPLTLTGDLHHYAHYVDEAADQARHKITSGGAGAYLSATHTLPETIRLPDHERLRGASDQEPTAWSRRYIYPPEARSREIASLESLRDPPLRRHTPSFAVLTAGVYGFLGLCVSLAFLSPYAWSVIGVLLAYGLYRGLRAFPRVGREDSKALARFHVALHLVPLALLCGVLAIVPAIGPWIVPLGAAMLGFFWGPYAFSRYLAWAIRRPFHPQANEVFAAQSQTEGKTHKHFLRIRIDSDGAVTLYPIGVPSVPRASDWEENPEARADPRAPWIRLKDGEQIDFELIEEPIEISRGGL